MTVRLFIGNLSYNVTDAELKELFSSVGPVSYVHMPTDHLTGKPRGFAFLDFNERADADEAVRRFNNYSFKGRSLAVNEARAREDRLPSRSSFQATATRPNTTAIAPESNRDGAGKDMGPDALPRRDRKKSKGSPRAESGPKGPMREVVRGQFFGGDDEDSYVDSTDEENFASRITDAEDEENK